MAAQKATIYMEISRSPALLLEIPIRKRIAMHAKAVILWKSPIKIVVPFVYLLGGNPGDLEKTIQIKRFPMTPVTHQMTTRVSPEALQGTALRWRYDSDPPPQGAPERPKDCPGPLWGAQRAL